MQFTRLRLNGFKSFVDPTDLVIARGLTGVVGPNGCGKSNLLEALRWVMGETRPSAMRGGGMEDVIFAGASTRPARNFAEVTLSIDNGARLAPAGFNDADGIDVVRRITRDAGSAYKCNTRDVRARDVQMLFADASTGSHSPALVRQGQISELINAQPKSRRRILEEAAGISGLYQRRHEAELKLRGTETNLDRVEDVVEQLAGQLNQLAKQARQAARYRTIGADLRAAEGLLLYRRWREADLALSEAREILSERLLIATRAEAATRAAISAREQAESAMPPLREESAIAAAVLQRLLVQRDTLSEQEKRALAEIATLEQRLAQLVKDGAREAVLTADAGETLERLDVERSAIAKAGAGHEARLDTATAAAQEAAEVLRDREAALSSLTEDVARLVARHQSVDRLLADSHKTLARSEGEAGKAREAVAQAEQAVRIGADVQAAAEQAQEAAQDGLAAAEDALAEAEDRRAEVQGAEVDARAASSEATGEAKALAAEVAALRRLVERDAGDGTQILDEARVSGGYEKALGAALGDDLKAARLRDGVGSGWAVLPDYDRIAALPDGATPLTDHVSGPDVLRRRLSQIGVIAPEQAAALQPLLAPGQRLVSLAGDLWRWDGYCASAADAPSAAALRLEQLNRLEGLQATLDEAEARAEEAAGHHAELTSALQAATQADRAARDARRAADTALADASRALSRAEADRNLAQGRVESLSLAVSRHEEEAAQARLQVGEAEQQAAALGDLDAARNVVEDVRTTVEAARLTMIARRSAQDELHREGEARTKRAQEILKEQTIWRNRLDTAETRIEDLRVRTEKTEADLRLARMAPADLAEKRAELSEAIETADARKISAVEAVDAAETSLRTAAQTERDAVSAAADASEARVRAEARVEAAQDISDAAMARIDEETGLTPAGLLAGLGAVPEQMPPSDEIETTIAKLRRSRDALGAVNLRAEEDARAIQEEHDTLVRERTDLASAIEKLRAGINGLNREGRERLLTAFEQVNANFATLFSHLFGGGEARLVLVESDDPLDAGLEIMCQPPGKKLSTLSLLSGGEQTLTAMALIFAVFLANPAPICVLDEVDAPLDDANVTRFCDLLDEMSRRTQTRFLVITHHAVTMSRMDRLYGVTMAEQGVSQLVSVDLKKAETLVA
ncbi:chromosome segregation protein SMC [Pseudoruegeria sp. SK021]|uniref:chromosome segregation protein SMC n=1 Tax=Pseudoruegeria sp. SK021 TaxID=1933035 RepID=UPI000A220736|nr:chromosome segregation protein SMC [Pseudoruegeria sp. SK021]OSP53742.1 chromosome segregation protein SMC [Pseudoruegeria sp. SK021]